MLNKIGNKIRSRTSPNDKIYTPLSVAMLMIEMCELKKGDSVLDPSAGKNKVFYNNLPNYVEKDYCEIEDDKDFFLYDKKVDCIIGNPPYSLWDKWLEHTMSLTDKFCYIFGFLNMNHSRIIKILENGFGITKIHLLRVDWWFGVSFIILFEKHKPSILTVSQLIICDICGERCKRGKKGKSPNECGIEKIKK
jgi:hypothetical protein